MSTPTPWPSRIWPPPCLIKPVTGKDTAEKGSAGVTEEHHGARDERLAARQRSERERSGRAAGAVGGRSYAFRRS